MFLFASSLAEAEIPPAQQLPAAAVPAWWNHSHPHWCPFRKKMWLLEKNIPKTPTCCYIFQETLIIFSIRGESVVIWSIPREIRWWIQGFRRIRIHRFFAPAWASDTSWSVGLEGSTSPKLSNLYLCVLSEITAESCLIDSDTYGPYVWILF